MCDMRRFFKTACHWLLWMSLATPVFAADSPGGGEFLRVAEPTPGKIELQVALRRMEKPGSPAAPAIWLCGVSHIGEPAYYQQLQQRLDQQTIVLYEAVGGLPRLGDDPSEDQRRRWTKQALQFVAMCADRYRGEQGEYPASLRVLTMWIRSRNKLLTAWLRQASIDAWSRPISYQLAGGKLTISASEDLKVTRSTPHPPRHDDSREDWSAQEELAGALGLVFQLDAIDYDKPHFRHSDLPISALSQRVRRRLAEHRPQPIEPKSAEPAAGERKSDDKAAVVAADDEESDEALDAMLQVMQGEGMVGGLLKRVVNFMKFSPRFAGLTKAVLVEALGSVRGDLSESAAMPPQMRHLMRTLIQDRNALVLDDLKKLIDSPRPPKSIGIFYGAGHMFDFQKNIVRELGYAPGREIWLTALRADAADTGLSDEDFRGVRAVIRFQMGQALRPIKADD